MAKSSADPSQTPLDPALPEKKRARRRLVGAVALLAVAAVAMSLVFDREPRPVQEELRIQLPARETTVSAPVVSGPSASGAVQPTADGATAPVQVPPPDKAPIAQAPGNSKTPEVKASEAKGTEMKAAETKPVESKAAESKAAESKPQPKADAKSEAPSAPKPKPAEAKMSDAKPADQKPGESKAAESKAAPAKAAAKGRYSVQLGAFASERGANELIAKVKASTTAAIGAQLYTEKVQTSAGERIRVRAGPFGDREAAEQVRAKLKQAGIESALIAP